MYSDSLSVCVVVGEGLIKHIIILCPHGLPFILKQRVGDHTPPESFRKLPLNRHNGRTNAEWRHSREAARRRQMLSAFRVRAHCPATSRWTLRTSVIQLSLMGAQSVRSPGEGSRAAVDKGTSSRTGHHDAHKLHPSIPLILTTKAENILFLIL